MFGGALMTILITFYVVNTLCELNSPMKETKNNN